MKCRGCEIDQDKNPYKARLFFTDDGYCSVCNAQRKDRKRAIKGMDKFIKVKTIKEGSYDHLSKRGRKITDYEATRDKYGGGTVVGNYNVNKIINNRKRRIDDFI